jgi:hypothetical protein
VNFSSPNIFVGFFFCRESWWGGTLSMNHFQSNLFYILYDIRLSSTFLWTFFFLRLKKGRVLVTVHQKYFYWSIEGTVNNLFWSHFTKICNPM